MSFAEKVKYVREKLGISQEKMAVLLGVSFATVNRWEKGRAKPSYETQEKFVALCKEHGINLEVVSQ